MASQGSNQLFDLLRALKRRRYQIAVPTALIATIGVAFAVIVPKRYRISTRIEISDRTRVEFDSRLRNPQEVAVRREAASASDHIRNFNRIKAVIEASLGQWPEYVKAPTDLERGAFIKDRILTFLSANPSVKDPKGGSIFIDVSFSDEDRTRAAGFLKDLVESWLTEMRELDRSTLIAEGRELKEIIDAQAADLNLKQDRYFSMIEILGQDPTLNGSDARREDRGDWTFKALEKAKTDLAEVEASLRTAEFELQQARERLQAEPRELSKREAVEGEDPDNELRKLETARDALEEKLANKRPSNSTYKKLKPKLDELLQEIEERRASGGAPEVFEHWVTVENPRVAEYEDAVRAQEDLVGSLEDQRDALAARVDDLEKDTKARTQHYKKLEDLENDVAEARALLNETQRQWADRDKSLQLLDSSPTPWRITQPPVPSSAATQPNPWLLSAVAVVLGLATGIGSALLAEFARNSYRSVSDLAAVMSVPVLGVIDTIVTRRERRRTQLAHAIAGLSTAVIVGTIGWVTWLWVSSPERLPLEVQDAIEQMRSALK